MSFHRVLRMLSQCAYQLSAWSPNDLKWPILTWKHNLLTNLPLGAVIFFLHLADLIWSHQMTPKWPQLISAIDSASQISYEKTYYTWGHLVDHWWLLNSNLIASQKKNWNRHITFSPSEICFQVSIGHWGLFLTPKFKSDKRNRLSVSLKHMIRHITCPKLRFGKRFLF